MKRILFWLVLALVGIVWLYQVRQFHREHDSRVYLVHDTDGRVQRFDLDQRGKVLDVSRVDDEDQFDPDRGVVREPAEGLPVPVVPGSRTTEARAEPPSPPRFDPPVQTTPRRGGRLTPRVRHHELAPPSPAETAGLLSVTGRLSATEERARRDARAKLEDLLAERLAPEVPRTWKAPSELIDGMIRQTLVVPRQRDYGTVYEATLKVDVSPSRRAEIVEAYHREEVVKRLAVLGALLVFVLVCLAAVSGYIQADEATKGYYTTRLRLAAAAGVGAAGVVVYRWLS